MSFLTAVPEELAAAAAQLGAIGNALTAQNAGAAAPTTAIAPAAADQVSILQSGIFTAYGALYQQIAAEAQAMQEQFVTTLGLSSGTYASTEASNATAASLTSGGVPDLINTVSTLLGGPVTSFGGQPFSLSGNTANVMSYEFGNWASASSNLLGLTGGGLLPAEEAAAEASALGGEAALGEIEAAEGVLGAEAALGGAPLAGLGEASAIGALSVPPSWAGPATLVSSTTTGALHGAGWTAAAPQAAPGMLYPGMPGLASAARNSAGFGAPRYGVKPIVMPKPVSV
ncbi:PPE family protein, SVP subgroup [Mycobacterium lacus]|uniref:PE family protein n=1 Tax=Mycobacterium lacus TaxID=169765 RepID=A0A1X1XZ74_9MYCO|nr:PE domain-containing protein [Mycobacterium lacus]MCV7124154.1 PE domain-containing protein [Mycobacterium lacus]ORW04054.1 PE family protein [Mycobacterium lacus]BBX97818.1 PE family protein [Mycobacterium lacus]